MFLVTEDITWPDIQPVNFATSSLAFRLLCSYGFQMLCISQEATATIQDLVERVKQLELEKMKTQNWNAGWKHQLKVYSWVWLYNRKYIHFHIIRLVIFRVWWFWSQILYLEIGCRYGFLTFGGNWHINFILCLFLLFFVFFG